MRNAKRGFMAVKAARDFWMDESVHREIPIVKKMDHTLVADLG
jgi:hypothetical protein